MKTLDDGLAEAISSLIWVAPRLQADVQELKIVADQFGAKYGKPYAMACRENAVGTVSEKLMHKLSASSTLSMQLLSSSRQTQNFVNATKKSKENWIIKKWRIQR